jgi:hypothetical protein
MLLGWLIAPEPVVGDPTRRPRAQFSYADAFGSASGLDDVRVVEAATASGDLTLAETGVSGTLRIDGRGVAGGRVWVELTTDGHGRVTGKLDGRRVDLHFRFGG